MGIRVGIDLGTTYSAVARIDPETGRAVIIPNKYGHAVTPSVVAVTEDGEELFGEDAKERQELGEPGTASFFKRVMGDPGFRLDLSGRPCTPVDLSAMLLKGLVGQAEMMSGEHVDAAVVTVPAYFRNAEREATLVAARQAGITVLGLLNEPTAAAFAYGLGGSNEGRTILVYDLGGGTFDVTLARVDAGEIRILGSDGDHYLGGKDWDDDVATWIADRFEDEFGEDPLDDAEQDDIIGVTAEKTKKRLTNATSAPVSVAWHGHRGRYTLTRREFDELTSYRLMRTADIIDRLFASFTPARRWSDVDGVILVGGSTRMPQVHEYVERMTGKPPLAGVNVDEAVALGAAIRANQDASGNATPPTIGGAKARNRALPLIGGRKITDATSHALGMIAESEDRERYVNDILIAKNAAIPARNTQRRELAVPRRGGELDVYLLQGSEPAPLDNDVAGLYAFTGIPYVDGGRTLIDVTYRYDADGVIKVSATQVETGRKLHMERRSIPDDMSWLERSPKENDRQAPPAGAVYLAIDFSGSMCGEPFRQAMDACRDFIASIDVAALNVGLIGFADRTKTYLEPTDDDGAIRQGIRDLAAGFDAEELSFGNDASPFPDVLAGGLDRYDGPKYAIVLTDGVWYDQDTAIRQARQCNEAGIDTIGLGFGGANETFIDAISSMKDLAQLTDLRHLGDSFSNIARVIGGSTGLVPGSSGTAISHPGR
ncbi:Hsp70 family protein [Bifidobacterium parmae]|uniref:Hsp70 protein n=1 Tax=Bifidobacterium parmae TaxID=361854 RepID=A0A2N5IVU2_9BIFI|nr:Hsp70 family protein [Bifidobacterium parmae]PLS26067.1 Hsp70 protein [Bifidobacterium parmae]